MVGRKRLELDFNKKYGRLILLTCLEDKHTTWRCRCDCGKEVKVRASSLKAGLTKSCGCLKKEANSKTGKANVGNKHGQTHGMYGTPEYNTWISMKQRCNNPHNNRYEHYGGRGIKVCNHWLNSFESFYNYMGEKPFPKFLFSIDRINNDGNYEPGNCKWSTRKEQSNNKGKYKKNR